MISKASVYPPSRLPPTVWAFWRRSVVVEARVGAVLVVMLTPLSAVMHWRRGLTCWPRRGPDRALSAITGQAPALSGDPALVNPQGRARKPAAGVQHGHYV